MPAPWSSMGSTGTRVAYSTALAVTQTSGPAGLATPLQYLRGIGPRRAALLARKGLHSVEDALYFVPRRHEDRTQLTPLARLQPGQSATCSGVIVGLSPPPPGRPLAPFTAMLRDESGYATASWFRAAYLARVLRRGQRLYLHGRVERYGGALTLRHPEFEIVESEADDRLS